jgi:hypothetical protein
VELALADLTAVERAERKARESWQGGREAGCVWYGWMTRAVAAAIKAVKALLCAGKLARSAWPELSPVQQAFVQSLGLITAKPMMLVANVNDTHMAMGSLAQVTLSPWCTTTYLTLLDSQHPQLARLEAIAPVVAISGASGAVSPLGSLRRRHLNACSQRWRSRAWQMTRRNSSSSRRSASPSLRCVCVCVCVCVCASGPVSLSLRPAGLALHCTIC